MKLFLFFVLLCIQVQSIEGGSSRCAPSSLLTSPYHCDMAKDRNGLDVHWKNAMIIPLGTGTPPLPRRVRVTGWQIYARQTGQIFFQIFKLVSGVTYELKGQTEFIATSLGVHNITVHQRITTEGGERVGFYYPADPILPYSEEGCTDGEVLFLKTPSGVTVGSQFHLKTLAACETYSFRPILEGVPCA